jgi:site-specific DNA-methyltransferase (adenine-specific)
MLELNKIYNEDCLEGMKLIDDKSIDMILCDLPYGSTSLKWDVIIPFDKLWEQYKRIIKDNGNLLLFSGEPFTSMLVMSNLKMFKYRLTWDKIRGSDFFNSHKKPLKSIEDICIFSKSKLGHCIYNPQIGYKQKDKIRKLGKIKPQKKTTYGVGSGKHAIGYDINKIIVWVVGQLPLHV